MILMDSRYLPLTLLVLAAAPGVAETIVVPVPSPYSYETTSLHQLHMNGSSGRYLGFTGRTTFEWAGTPAQLNPGNPGILQCDREREKEREKERCWLRGYIAPSLYGGMPAGSTSSFFRYQLDCFDNTFNRIGDASVPGSMNNGWQRVENDPTALAVAQTWCPRIQELP